MGNQSLKSLEIIPKYVEQSSWWQHVPIAHWIISATKPKTVVELGTHYGVSFFAFCEAAEAYAHDCFVYAVDSWEGDAQSGKYGRDVLSTVKNHWLKNHKKNSRLIKGKFEDALEYFGDGKIDLLHIDGFHTYDAVKNDFETWRRKLSKTAIILFHDINVRENNFGVWRFWEELKETKDYKFIELLNGHGLGIAFDPIHADKFAQMKEIMPALITKGLILERMAKAELIIRGMDDKEKGGRQIQQGI